MHFGILRILAVALALLPAAALAGGAVEGVVKLEGNGPKVAPYQVLKDAGVCGKEKPNESIMIGANGTLRNVVVKLRGSATQAKLEPTANAKIDQVACRYEPHVQSVTAGTPMTVLNNDAVLHNVHGIWENNLTVCNVAMPIKGQKLPVKLTKPGVVRLQCDAGHTWMNAYVYVADTPWHAVTDDKGAFKIENVPPGEYTMELWHEPVGGQGPGVRKTMKVTVPADGPAKVEASMKLN